jgi:lysyl endopeptidase
MKFKIILLSFFISLTAYSQVTNEGRPVSWGINELQEVTPVIMPQFDLKKLQAEDKANEARKDKPWRYGHEFMVDHNLSNSGSWHDLPNGDRIWRIRFASRGAKTMNFLFSDFYMPAGAKVYLYNNDRSDLLGAYDAKQNNENRVLGTWLVKGEDIWIEYYEPAAVAGQGKLEIFKVIHGYRTAGSIAKSPDDALNGSANCNYDVDCFMADIEGLKDINKKAVGLIIVDDSSFCTGALINNTSNDGTPYFLTAEHCYSNPANWAFRFNWISPDPVCAQNTNSTNTDEYYETVSGAVLRAKREASDFCLVEITADLPDDWDLVWAGWNRSETPAESTFGIHHPSGDIMKACRDLQSPNIDNSNGQFMWEVEDWDLGVTEGGSSGSPLFDEEGRIIGQLFGGIASCSGLTDNGGYDVYGRLDVSWDAGSSSASRLKEWLDPLETDAVTVDYYPPQVVYALNAKVSIEDLGQDQCSNGIAPVIELTNKGTQSLTAAEIHYYLNDNEPVIYNWSGNLATDENITINLPVLQGESGDNAFTVSIVSINGGNDQYPSDNTVVRDFTINIFMPDTITFQLETDSFGDETTWELTDEDGDVLYEGGPYGENSTDTETFFLGEGCYTFTIYDEFGDGICCGWAGNGSYSLTLDDGTVIIEGGAFGESESVNFALDDNLSMETYTLKASVRIYPNPSSGLFSIDAESALHYRLYNALGQQVRAGEITAGTGTLSLADASSGVYLLAVQDESGRETSFKLIKE